MSFIRIPGFDDEQQNNISLDDINIDNIDELLGAEGDFGSDYQDERGRYLNNFDPMSQIRVGDVQLPVKPEAIQVTTVNETATNPSNVIRSQSKNPISSGHNLRQVRFSFKISGPEQINGTQKEAEDIAGEPIELIANIDSVIGEGAEPNLVQPTYYINGLRALLAQFKVAPFLPIENYKINNENNIDAVTLQNITVSNVSQFPEALKIECIFMEFNYNVYLDTVEPFKAAFNWDLFRYHYQRILEGTEMHYERGSKLPKINSIDAEHFSVDVVERESLDQHEEAVNFLSDIPRFVEDVTLEHEEGDFWGSIEDAKKFRDAQLQYDKFQELKEEMLTRYTNSSHHPFEDNSINSFADLYDELQDITSRLDDSYLPHELPVGIDPQRPDYRFEDYSLMQEYRDWVNNTAELETDKMYFYPLEDFRISGEHSYNKNSHRFIFDEIWSVNNAITVQSSRNKIIQQHENNTGLATELEEALGSLDREARPFSFHITVRNFDNIKDLIIKRGTDNEDMYDTATSAREEGWKDYDFYNIAFDDLFIQDISISYMNDVITQNVSMQTRPAHQYLGSKEIKINAEAVVTSQEELQKLNYLVEHSQELIQRYSQILEGPVLKLNNSIAKLFGLDGVYIESVSDETIPNFPEGRAVQISFLGYWHSSNGIESLTTRYRTKATDMLDQGLDEIATPGGGVATDDEIQSYMELKEELKNINLYPDLELPKYNELPVNYHDEFEIELENTAYVDPDYYTLNINRLFAEEALKVTDEEHFPTSEMHMADTNGYYGDTNNQQSGPEPDFDEDGDWPSRYFTEEDFANNVGMTEQDSIHPWEQVELNSKPRQLLLGLDILQHAIGEENEIKVTHSVRTESWNSANGGAANSHHLTRHWKAVDITCYNMPVKQLMQAVEDLDIFTGRGLYPDSNFIHVDTRNGLSSSEGSLIRWVQKEEGRTIYPSDTSTGYIGPNYKEELNNTPSVLKKDDKQAIVDELDDIEDTEEVESIEQPDSIPELRNSTTDILNTGKKISNDHSFFNDNQEKGVDGMTDLIYEILKQIDHRTDEPLQYSAKQHASILASFVLPNWNSNLSYSPEDSYEEYDMNYIPTKYQLKRSDSPTEGGASHFSLSQNTNDIFAEWSKQDSGSNSVNQKYLENNFPMQIATTVAAANEAYLNVYDIIDDYSIEDTGIDIGGDDTWSGQYAGFNLGDMYNTDDLLKLYFAYMFAHDITLDDMAEVTDNFDTEQQKFRQSHKEINDLDGMGRNAATYSFSNEELDKIGDISHIYAQQMKEDGAISKDKFGEFDFQDDDYLINLRSEKQRYNSTFHDMFKYDQRGRLLRAFPTYYLMLIDESDDFFVWRMQDLFYDFQGIESLDVVKDKQNIADVCHIQMADHNGLLSDATGGHKQLDIEHGFFQTIMSSINVFSDFNDEVAARAVDTNTVELQTGARLHLRVGYGSSPDQLPTVFNGRITELELGPQVQLTAQSDAIELNKPFTDIGPKETSADVTGGVIEQLAGAHWFESVHEPTQLIAALYDYEDGFFNWIARRVSSLQEDLQSSVWGKRPEHDFRSLGSFVIPEWWKGNSLITQRHNFFQPEANRIRDIIYKFGDWEQEFPLNFEIAQNTYMIRDLSAPNIKRDDTLMEINMYGKTPWEVLQTCAMAAPNYVAEVLPFGVDRSTIFFGHPSFDLAYDYSLERMPTPTDPDISEDIKSLEEDPLEHYAIDIPGRDAQQNIDEAIAAMNQRFEKQGEYAEVGEDLKTFRQMRVYGSFQDIIANQIIAREGFPTSVKPVVSDSGGDVRKNDPIYLDADIKPEFQHQVQIDTSINIGNPIRRFNNQILPFYDTGCEHIADEIAASALAQHVREMYQGQLTVMGDPTAKPYDYSYLYDLKEQMNGFFEIGSVVHSMNKETGFMTNIEPDPIVFKNSGARADGEYLMWAQSRMQEIYRTYFVSRAILLTMLGSESILAKANITNALLGYTKGLAKGMTSKTAKKVSAINGGMERIASLLQDKANLTVRGNWENYYQTFGKKLETLRANTNSSLKYIKKATAGGPTNTLGKAGNYFTNLSTGSQLGGTAAVSGKKNAVLYGLGSLLKGSATTLTALTTGPGGLALKLIGSWLIVDRVQEWLDNFRRPQKTPLTLMLLNKNGEPFAAGIDGAKRALVGENPDSFIYDFLFDNPIFNFFAGHDEREDQIRSMQQHLAESQGLFDAQMSDIMSKWHLDLYQESEFALRGKDKIADSYQQEMKSMYEDTIWRPPEEQPQVDLPTYERGPTGSGAVGGYDLLNLDIPGKVIGDPLADEGIDYEPEVTQTPEDMEPGQVSSPEELADLGTKRSNSITEELEYIVTKFGAPRAFDNYGGANIHPELKNKLQGIELLEHMQDAGMLEIFDSAPEQFDAGYERFYDKGAGLQFKMDQELYQKRLKNSPQENPFDNIIEQLRWGAGIEAFIVKDNRMHIDLGRSILNKDR